MDDIVYTVEDIKEKLYPVFLSYNVNSAVLFGSYAKNNAKVTSDIDICVDSGLKGMAFYGLLEDITETLHKRIDLIDVSQIEPTSRVNFEVMRTGIKIYG